MQGPLVADAPAYRRRLNNAATLPIPSTSFISRLRKPGPGPRPLLPRGVLVPAGIMSPVFGTIGGANGIVQDNEAVSITGTVANADCGYHRPPALRVGRRFPGPGPSPLVPRAIRGLQTPISAPLTETQPDQTVAIYGTVPDGFTTGTKWNGADSTGNVSLSSDTSTATTTNTSQAGIRSTTSKAFGKVYVECTPANTSTNERVGIANGSWSEADPNGLGGDNNSIAIDSANTYLLNNVPTTAVHAPWVVGTPIRVAIDFLNKSLWMAVGGGLWNNSSTANPATGVGGFSFATIAGGPYYVAFGDVGSGGDAVTVNFGGSTFFANPPSGFSAWDSLTASIPFAVTRPGLRGPGLGPRPIVARAVPAPSPSSFLTLAETQDDQSLSGATSVIGGSALAATQPDQAIAGAAYAPFDPGYWLRLNPRPGQFMPGIGPRPLVPRAVPDSTVSPPIFGGLSVSQQGDETLSAAIMAVSGCTLAVTQDNHSIAATATVIAGGTLTPTQADEALAGNAYAPWDPGYWLRLDTRPGRLSPGIGPRPLIPTAVRAPATMQPVFGTLIATQDVQTTADTGRVLVGGTLAATQPDETLSASSTVLANVTLTITQGSESLDSASIVLINGTLNQTSTQVISGAVFSPWDPGYWLRLVSRPGTLEPGRGPRPIVAKAIPAASTMYPSFGTLGAVQADQAVVSAAVVPITGALATPQTDDTLTSAGSAICAGSLSAMQTNGTLSATANGLSLSAVNQTQNDQLLSSNARAPDSATLAVVQAGQALISGIGGTWTGALAIAETDQSIASYTSVVVGGSLVAISESQGVTTNVSLLGGISTRRLVHIAPDIRLVKIASQHRTVQIAPDSRLYIIPPD